MASGCIRALILLSLLCRAFTGAEAVKDCCLSTTDKFFPLIRILDYELQEAGEGCEISATIFTTKNSNTVCIVHPEEKNKKTKWVKSHIQQLKRRKAQKK